MAWSEKKYVEKVVSDQDKLLTEHYVCRSVGPFSHYEYFQIMLCQMQKNEDFEMLRQMQTTVFQFFIEALLYLTENFSLLLFKKNSESFIN